MPRVNVQADVRQRLADALAPVAVRTHVPDPRPDELVVVQRAGGRKLDELRDRPGLDLLVWAKTEARAAELAMAAADVLLALPRTAFRDGYADVEEETLRSDPDIKAKLPRWYGSYTITTYKY